MNRQFLLAWLVACHCCADSVFGEVWTSPDGAISVARPEASQFVELGAAPDLLILWVSKDETVKLGVTHMSIPQGAPLLQKSLEEGFRETLNGTITDSRTENVHGYTVFKMSSRGNVLGKDVSGMQRVVAIGDAVYKVMAIGVGKDINASDDARTFIGSLRILRESTGPVETMPGNEPAKGGSGEPGASLVHLLSKWIGALSLLALLVCVVILVLKRGSQRGRVPLDVGSDRTESAREEGPSETNKA